MITFAQNNNLPIIAQSCAYQLCKFVLRQMSVSTVALIWLHKIVPVSQFMFVRWHFHFQSELPPSTNSCVEHKPTTKTMGTLHEMDRGLSLLRQTIQEIVQQFDFLQLSPEEAEQNRIALENVQVSSLTSYETDEILKLFRVHNSYVSWSCRTR